MTQEVKIILGIGITTVIILFGGVSFLTKNQEVAQNAENDPIVLIKPYNHTISSDSAKVTLIEFADFQCPACAAMHPLVKQLLDEYKGKVNFVYRHFPLPQHKNAILAIGAAEAAGEQGKFWEMYDLLYQNQNEWSDAQDGEKIFINYAKRLNLKIDTFTEVLKTTTYVAQIQQDTQDGKTLGVNSTPTFFVNNKKLIGVPSYQNLKSSIEELIK